MIKSTIVDTKNYGLIESCLRKPYISVMQEKAIHQALSNHDDLLLYLNKLTATPTMSQPSFTMAKHLSVKQGSNPLLNAGHGTIAQTLKKFDALGDTTQTVTYSLDERKDLGKFGGFKCTKTVITPMSKDQPTPPGPSQTVFKKPLKDLLATFEKRLGSGEEF